MRGGSTAGLAVSLRGSSRLHYALLTLLDTLFSSLVVAPAIVGYWRSVWELMGEYVFPEDVVSSSMVSLTIGLIGHLVFTFHQHTLERWFHPDRRRILYYVASRIYTLVFAFVCVNGWRGTWRLLDTYTEEELTTVLATTVVSVVALCAMRAIRNLSAPPFAIVTDGVEGYFEVPTMFRISVKDKTSLYILDCLFSVIVLGTLVVFVWRGAWVLLDMYLFPDDEVASSWGSLILGYSATALVFLAQPGVRWLCEKLEGLPRILTADVFLTLSFFATVNVWRGIWNLLNIYFLPDNMKLSCWITHWCCFMLLVVLKCSNSLLVRGVFIDGEEPGGKCVSFPCYYLRSMFLHERQKKVIKKHQQLHAMVKRKNDMMDNSIKAGPPPNVQCICTISGTNLTQNHLAAISACTTTTTASPAVTPNNITINIPHSTIPNQLGKVETSATTPQEKVILSNHV